MSSLDEQSLVAMIDVYLQKSDKATKEEVCQIIKMAQNFAKSNQNHRFIKLTFASLKKQLKKDNFSFTSKRFLLLIDQLLQFSAQVPLFKNYSAEISRGIVDIYLFVFTMIFQYQILDSAVQWKVYRMLWAKLINDETFDSIRTKVAQSFCNFDLNRGFSKENIEKINKRYKRKKFTENQINRYLDSSRYEAKKVIENSDNTTEVPFQQEKKRHSENLRSSVSPGNLSNNFPLQTKSLVKVPQTVFEKSKFSNKQGQKSNPNIYGNNQLKLIPQNISQNSDKQGYRAYNEKPEILMYGYNYNTSGFYNPPSAIFPIQNTTLNMQQNLMKHPNYYNIPTQSNTYTKCGNPQNVQMIQNINYMNSKLAPSLSFLTQQENNLKRNSNFEVPSINGQNFVLPQDQFKKNNFLKVDIVEEQSKPLIQKDQHKNQSQKIKQNYSEKEAYDYLVIKELRLRLTSQLYECRECGLFAKSRQFLEEHIYSHLLSAQNDYFKKESQILGQNKGIFQKNTSGNLLTIEKWVKISVFQQNSKPFQISMNGLKKESGNRNCIIYSCFFCQEELKVSWCVELQDWTLKDTVKVRVNGEITVSHYSCYNQFSNETNLSMSESLY